MAPPPGRLGSVVKLPVQVRMFPEEIEAVDAFAAELSQQSYGAAFSRAEALRIAAMEWLKERQARRVSVTTSQPSSAPEAARVVTAPSPLPYRQRPSLVRTRQKLRQRMPPLRQRPRLQSAQGVPVPGVDN